MGKTDIALAMNTNSTEVVSQDSVNHVLPVSPDGVFNIENNLPKIRLTATVSHDINQNLSALVRINYYGETMDERSGREVVDPTQLIDLELRYDMSSNLSMVFGSNNILNTYPTEITGRNSVGLPYPRRTPIGYHGGMTYLRLMYNF